MDRLSEYIHNLNLRDGQEKPNIVDCVGVIGKAEETMSLFVCYIRYPMFCFNFKFAIGWWVAIDAAAAYHLNDQLLKAFHTCGALATLALIMYKLPSCCFNIQTSLLLDIGHIIEPLL